MNRISDSHQKEQPENFQGGIIADPMGLGKTLTMIALTASDLMWVSLARRGNNEFASVGQTLVIVPPPRMFTKIGAVVIGSANQPPNSVRYMGRAVDRVSLLLIMTTSGNPSSLIHAQ